MKKLTAGIFSVLLGLVSVGGANAAVVSTEYLSEVLQTELAKKQDTLTIDTEVKANSTNLVTSGAVSNAISAANTGVQTLQKTVESQGTKITGLEEAVGVMQDDESGVLATAKTYADNIVSGLASGAVATNTANIATLNGDATTSGSVAKAVADAKTELQDSINLKADKTALEATDANVAANETAIATEKSAREAADAQLQGKIDLKADAADVTGVTYSGTNYLNEQTGLKAATIKLDAQVKANADTIAILEGGETAEGSIKNLTAQINDNKAAIALLNDTAATPGSVENSIQEALGGLDVADGATTGQFVTAVSQENGVITVSRAALVASDIPTLSIEKVNGLQAALDAKQVSLTGQEGVIVVAGGVISIASQGIGTDQLKDASVTADKMAKDSVTSNAIADNAVTAGKLAANAVEKGNIAKGAVDTNSIADNAVGAAQLAADVNSLLAGAIQAPTSENAEGTFVLTAKKITGTDGAVTYSYAWEDIAGRDE